MSYTGLENYGKIINGVQFYNYKAIMQMADVDKETALVQINASDPQNEYISYPQLSKIVMDLKMDQLEKMPNKAPKEEKRKTPVVKTSPIIKKVQNTYDISYGYATRIVALAESHEISNKQLQEMMKDHPSSNVLFKDLMINERKFTDKHGLLISDFVKKMHLGTKHVENSITKLKVKSSPELRGFYTITQLNMIAKDLLKRPSIKRNKEAVQNLNNWLSSTKTTPNQEGTTMLNRSKASKVLADYYQTSQGNAQTIFSIIAPRVPRTKMKLENDARPVFYYNKKDLLSLFKQFKTAQELKKSYLNNDHSNTTELTKPKETVQKVPSTPKPSFFQRIFGRK